MTHRSSTDRFPLTCIGNTVQHDRDDDDGDTIPQDCLKKLADSSALKALLLNRHLQQLLLQVDGAPNKAAAVERLMQEPLFVEFADQCLAVVSPEENANVAS